jgi:Na+/H+ antiporter NhaC
MAILIPTGIPVAYALDGNQYGITTMISLGAVLDGAIFGDHCSPVSDTTILSAIASKCDLMRHVNTQLPYSLFTAAIAMLIGYLPAAMGLNWIETVVIATIVIIILLAIIKKLQKPIMTV